MIRLATDSANAALSKPGAGCQDQVEMFTRPGQWRVGGKKKSSGNSSVGVIQGD